jgi:peptidoglycan/LPS O-acetylase OafA/YrhL
VVALWRPCGGAVEAVWWRCGWSGRAGRDNDRGMTTTPHRSRRSGQNLRSVPSAARSAGRAVTYRSQAGITVLAAFALSAAYTIYLTVAGTADPGFDATAPAAWAFYAVGFGVAALARSARRPAAWTVAAALTVLLAVALFLYPSTFTAAQQTTFGWFENDVYTGLLMLGLCLTVQNLRGTVLTPAAAGRIPDGQR